MTAPRDAAGPQGAGRATSASASGASHVTPAALHDLQADATARGGARSHRGMSMVTPTGLEPVSRP